MTQQKFIPKAGSASGLTLTDNNNNNNNNKQTNKQQQYTTINDTTEVHTKSRECKWFNSYW